MQSTNDNFLDKNTLKKRYFYKVTSNIVTILSGLFTSAIVPRALGVNAYGDFSFVNNVISQILSFLDMRASTCFYVKLSQRQSESKIITFYGIYTLLIFFILFIIVSILSIPSSRHFILENVDEKIIWFSFVLIIAKWIVDVFIKISDAYGATVAIERIKMVNQGLSVILLVLLFYFDLINISFFYLHQIFIFLFLGFLMYNFFKSKKYQIPFIAPIELSAVKSYTKEFVSFSAPLLIFLIAQLVVEIFDRNILQHFGGSYQQGLYGFSFSISTMTILFVVAMVPLFTRELSIAFASNNLESAASLYRKYVPVIYVVSAFFCSFLFINAQGLIFLFGGEQYYESLVTLKIMLFYPLVSTYSNLNSSVIYAKSGTTIIRNIALVLSPIGMLLSFLLISSSFFNLGASGLAIKVLTLESVSVIIILLHISKYLKIKLFKYFVHMVFAPLTLLLIAFAIKWILEYFSFSSDFSIFSFVFSGFIYSLLTGSLIFIFPSFAGLSRSNIDLALKKIKEYAY